jgi:magnesium chelatase subunit D
MSGAHASKAIEPAGEASCDIAVWDDALMAARLFAVNPAGLGGIALRSAPSPVRELWLDYLRALLAPGTPLRRLPCGIADDRLLGGLDLAATLKAGRPIIQNGILIEADRGIVLIAMAERLSAGAAARIAAALDQGAVVIERDGVARRVATSIGLVALDEGATPEEQLPAALAGRLAFHVNLEALAFRGLRVPRDEAAMIAAAKTRLDSIGPVARECVEALVKAALSFGIGSVVAPLLALKVARAAAALAGRDAVTRDDAVLAARLVLAPRATMLPDEEPDASAPEPQPDQDTPDDGYNDDDGAGEESANEDQPLQSLDDMMCEAVQAALPAGLLESLNNGRRERQAAAPRDGTGGARMSLQRGRPIGARMGVLRSGARLALVDTLRAAAPWQPVRRAERAGDGNVGAVRRIEVRREDFRIKQFVQRRESSILFCVDASGSAAFHRLAEAKGAVELLLGEAYVARTYAALIAFRGTGAEVLLPPSRSLTRAKALLSTLPGGGGTPLAAGIDASVVIALAERARGRDPLIVFLTDGQANIARDGRAVRSQAFADALAAAGALAAQGLAAVFVDTAPRAREEGGKLATAMGARYLALPYVEARAVRDFVRAAAP